MIGAVPLIDLLRSVPFPDAPQVGRSGSANQHRMWRHGRPEALAPSGLSLQCPQHLLRRLPVPVARQVG